MIKNKLLINYRAIGIKEKLFRKLGRFRKKQNVDLEWRFSENNSLKVSFEIIKNTQSINTRLKFKLYYYSIVPGTAMLVYNACI